MYLDPWPEAVRPGPAGKISNIRHKGRPLYILFDLHLEVWYGRMNRMVERRDKGVKRFTCQLEIAKT